jgi:hypothetical protein
VAVFKILKEIRLLMIMRNLSCNLEKADLAIVSLVLQELTIFVVNLIFKVKQVLVSLLLALHKEFFIKRRFHLFIHLFNLLRHDPVIQNSFCIDYFVLSNSNLSL